MSAEPVLQEAEILAVGSELLGPARLDTNSLYLTGQLNALGIEVKRKSILPDEVRPLADAIRASCARVPLVLCCGGLGPTDDDLTREAAALGLGVALERDPEAEALLRAYFERRNRPMPANNLRQADRLRGAAWLRNEVGSAPGQWCSTNQGLLILLPGPPPELRRMFSGEALPRLRRLAPSRVAFTRVLSIAGMSESAVDALAAPIYRSAAPTRTTILATSELQVELHFQTWSPTLATAQAASDRVAGAIEARLGDAVFSREQRTLAAEVGRMLIHRHQTVALAESCTGGLLGERLTHEAGASGFFLGGVVCYSNASKQRMLEVSPATLEREGAVSAACACELAEGARKRFGSTWGIAITGIAGPDGGTPEKPVGTVFIALAGPGDGPAMAAIHRLAGDRDRVRRWSVHLALDQLRLRLLYLA